MYGLIVAVGGRAPFSYRMICHRGYTFDVSRPSFRLVVVEVLNRGLCMQVESEAVHASTNDERCTRLLRQLIARGVVLYRHDVFEPNKAVAVQPACLVAFEAARNAQTVSFTSCSTRNDYLVY